MGLLDVLKKRASHLGGDAAGRFLRAIGKPAFIAYAGLVAALIRDGVVDRPPSGKRDLATIQAAFNQLVRGIRPRFNGDQSCPRHEREFVTRRIFGSAVEAATHMSDPVPAITEAAATGETAAIFADIRNVLGVDVVNLIWRHLATIDGALPWAWGTLRPLYADGSVGNEAQALRAALMLPPAPPIPAEVFAGLGLRPHDLTDIRGVLSSYAHTNAMAVVALSALQAQLDGHLPRGVVPAQPSSVTASPLIALPRLLPWPRCRPTPPHW